MTADRSLEFTWTRHEAIGLLRTVTRPALVTTIVAFAGGAVLLGLLTGSTVLALVMILTGIVLVTRNILRPGYVWDHGHPVVSGTHRISWTDELVRIENPTSTLEMRAGSLCKVELAPGLIILRSRQFAVFRGIPIRAFSEEQQRDDLLAVSRAIASAAASIRAATEEQRSRRRNLVGTIAFGVAIVVVARMTR